MDKGQLQSAAEDRRRKREMKKCLKSTYYLATKYLGFDLLTEWHEARLAVFDERRDDLFQLWLAPRGHYKTTLAEAEVIRDILEDPEKCHLMTHASSSRVKENVESIAQQFTHNQRLRWLRPEIMPALHDSDFFTATPEPRFTVKRNRYSKQPTVMGAQSGKEITGAHIDGKIWLDDIVGEKTLEDTGGMNKIRKWYGSTIMNVAQFDQGCQIRGRGTRWHLLDFWNDCLNSEDWFSMVDSCLVDENGRPDYKGKSVLFSEDIIQMKMRQMTHIEFALQMMNLPLTEEMRVWDETEEQECTWDEVPEGKIIILSDPAPKGAGAVDKAKQKERGGVGDYWGICAVSFVVKKHRLIRYRLTARQSNLWTWDDGLEAVLDEMERWGTNLVCIEEGSQTKGMYSQRLKELARKRGLPKPRFIEMKSFSKGKNWRHAQLAGLNSGEELVFVTDLIDEGTAELERAQCRDHPQSRFDDLMDSLSLCTDPAVVEKAPKADKFIPKMINRARKKRLWKRRTRHVY